MKHQSLEIFGKFLEETPVLEGNYFSKISTFLRILLKETKVLRFHNGNT